MPSKTPSEIIAQIERAFAKVRLGDGVSIREAIVIDDYGDAGQRRAARNQDEKGDWRLIPDSIISNSSSALSFFDLEGMRYNLPAFMRFTLRNFDSDSNSISATVFSVSNGENTKFQLLTPDQRDAVRAFLEFLRDEPTGWFRDKTTKALPLW